jgi:WD40 repeat protein
MAFSPHEQRVLTGAGMDEETLFAAALKWDDPAKRAAFLLGACGGDEPLRRNVEELLHAHDQAGNFLEKPAISRAAPPTELGLPETPTEIVPKQLGDYRIVREIGRGGMGIVYEAVHVRLGRRVALKVLSRRIGGDRRFLDRFEREGRAAARLSHANIVAAFDLGEDAGVHFLVLEYIAGRNLAEVVRAEGPLPAARAVECAVQAAEALAHAHSQGLVHRDVKPSNLLLADDGTVKLLDLGLVRFDDLLEDRKTATASPDKRSLTESGAIIGTMSYMAPEQATSPSTADARVDIYSLGCTLFYLLTGRPPFAGETSFAILLAHREEAIPALRDAAEGVPTALEAVFRRMAAKRPEDRYASMVEVIEALRAALEIASGRHADRRQTSALVPQAARMPSRRGVYLALAVLFIAAISAGPWFAWPRRQPGAASSNANKEDTQDTRLCALDALQRVDIDPYELQEAGSFDPNAGAPSELVAILGDSRLKHWYYISSLAFSPDGQTLASGSWDSTVCLWDAATGRRRRTLDASDWVGSIALQSSGKLLAAALRSGTIIVWDVATGAEARRFPARRPHPWPVVRFSPDGTILAWGAHTDIQLWDVHGGDVDVLSGAATKIEDLAFSGGGDTLAVAGANGTVQIFDLAKRHVASVCKGDGPAIGSVAYASDGRVAAGDKHGTLYLFDPATGERACQARAGGGAINGMIAGPEPASLLSASHDGLIREWQATSIGTAPAALAVRRTLGPARTPLWCLARSSRQVAAGGLGQAVRLWDWPSGAETVHGAGHAARATSLALSPDGRRLASGGDDFAVGIWDVASARPLRFLGGYTERVFARRPNRVGAVHRRQIEALGPRAECPARRPNNADGRERFCRHARRHALRCGRAGRLRRCLGRQRAPATLHVDVRRARHHRARLQRRRQLAGGRGRRP